MLQLHLNSVDVFVVVRLEPRQSVLKADHAWKEKWRGVGTAEALIPELLESRARASPLAEHLGEHLPRPLVSRQA